MTTTVPYDTMSVSSKSEPVYRKCCFCFPLRTGCFILGYFNLIFNVYHIITLLVFTAGFEILFATGDYERFGFDRSNIDDDLSKPPLAFEKSLLNQIELILIVTICVNIVWLVINVACLVGLHKKRPGPIKVFVGFASARLVLFVCGFLYLVMTASAYTHSFVSYTFDLGLNTYFIFVYYIYAMQLEQELNETHTKQEESLPRIEKGPFPDSDEKGNSIAFIYPIEVDKVHLVV